MKRDNVSKDYLLKKIYFELGIPTSFSKKIINSIFDIIIEGLQKDGKVKLSGFGTFKILSKKRRVGRNPKNKIEYEISPRKTVSFAISDEVKRKINSGF